MLFGSWDYNYFDENVNVILIHFCIKIQASDPNGAGNIISWLCTNMLQKFCLRYVHIQYFRVFVATWNVGGKTPDIDLRLEEFLQVEGSSDIYVLG